MRRVSVGVVLVLVVVLVLAVVRSRIHDGRDTGAITGACTEPSFTTSAEQDVWRNGGYRVEPDMWNNTVGTQTLRACSYRNWYVTASQPDTASVKVYPDVNLELHGASLHSLSRITSRFGSAGPGTGVYEYAYDVWLNGNVLHVPRRGTFSSGGRSYSAYRAGHFIAYVDQHSAGSGELDLRAFFDHAISKGWLSESARIRRIEFGVEICSTGGIPMRFGVTDFSVATS